MTQTEALKLALEALESLSMNDYSGYEISKHETYKIDNAITALTEALAEQPAQKRPQNCGTGYCSCIECVMELPQPQQEPVATLWQHGETGRTRITMPNDITDCDARWFKAADLYTSSPQRTWVGLTDEEIIIMSRYDLEYAALIGEVQRKLKEKNT